MHFLVVQKVFALMADRGATTADKKSNTPTVREGPPLRGRMLCGKPLTKIKLDTFRSLDTVHHTIRYGIFTCAQKLMGGPP